MFEDVNEVLGESHLHILIKEDVVVDRFALELNDFGAYRQVNLLWHALMFDINFVGDGCGGIQHHRGSGILTVDGLVVFGLLEELHGSTLAKRVEVELLGGPHNLVDDLAAGFGLDVALDALERFEWDIDLVGIIDVHARLYETITAQKELALRKTDLAITTTQRGLDVVDGSIGGRVWMHGQVEGSHSSIDDGVEREATDATAAGLVGLGKEVPIILCVGQTQVTIAVLQRHSQLALLGHIHLIEVGLEGLQNALHARIGLQQEHVLRVDGHIQRHHVEVVVPKIVEGLAAMSLQSNLAEAQILLGVLGVGECHQVRYGDVVESGHVGQFVGHLIGVGLELCELDDLKLGEVGSGVVGGRCHSRLNLDEILQGSTDAVGVDSLQEQEGFIVTQVVVEEGVTWLHATQYGFGEHTILESVACSIGALCDEDRVVGALTSQFGSHQQVQIILNKMGS